MEQKNRAQNGIFSNWLILLLVVDQVFSQLQSHIIKAWVLSLVLLNIRVKINGLSVLHKHFSKFVLWHGENLFEQPKCCKVLKLSTDNLRGKE